MKKPLNELFALGSRGNPTLKLIQRSYKKFQKIAIFLTFGNLPNRNFLEGMNMGVC